jgi:predicted nucleotidyltransferase
MERSQVIAILNRHRPELEALGVVRLYLFGSIARGTATEYSDVDVAVTLAPELRGLARVGALVDVESLLSELLQCHVDVVEEPARSPSIRQAIERDGLRAF